MNDLVNRIANLPPEARALFEAKLRQKTRANKHTIPTLPRSGEAPAFAQSFAQQRLWFLCQWEPHSAFYNISSALKLEGELDVAAFERCINEIVKRHESLRTSFTTQENEAVQIILRRPTPKFRSLICAAFHHPSATPRCAGSPPKSQSVHSICRARR